MIPQATSDQYRAQQRIIVATLGLTRKEWASMGTDFDASWSRVGPRISLLTASAQLGAAKNGAASVPAVLAEIGQSVDPLGEVNPRAFAGIASDGRPLGSLLDIAVIRAKQATQGVIITEDNVTTYTRGATPQEALRLGGSWLDMAIHTAIADAARGAAGVGIAARPGIGWERMVNPPCCKDCAVLAGKVYKWNAGFDRHPNCDCTHVACGENAKPGLTNDPPLNQVTGLTKAEHKALDDGADLGQVVNAKRGGSKMTTTEGMTKRGLAGQRLGKGRQRLTPDGIYRIASDRTEAMTLLKKHGYLL